MRLSRCPVSQRSLLLQVHCAVICLAEVQISIADIRLCAWLARVVNHSGDNCTDSGFRVDESETALYTGITFPMDSFPNTQSN